MDPEKERIEYLRRELHRHNYNYYVANSPEIGDKEFDMLMKELEALEEIGRASCRERVCLYV